jgi:Ca2+-binding RTX toxin-like protein
MTGGLGDDVLNGGADNDRLEGNDGSDHLIGGTGNDLIQSGAGIDVMEGGAGNDIYFGVEDPSDVVVERANGGIDEIVTTLSTYVLPDNIENLFFNTPIGTSTVTGIGNKLDNAMNSGNGATTLFGEGGNDTLTGRNGDTLIGGVGNDTYVVDGATAVTAESAGEGIDTVQLRFQSPANYTLADNIENLVVTGGTPNVGATGNGLDNVMTGDAGSNRLDGAGGNDTLVGGDGNDTLSGGTGKDSLSGGDGSDLYILSAGDETDKIVETADGIGSDRVELHFGGATPYLLPANVEELVMAVGSAAKDAVGNALDNRLFGNDLANKLDGGAGNDQINGGTGEDVLTGGAGDDNLIGQDPGDLNQQHDTLIGGSGNDTYILLDTTDTIVEDRNQGIDTILTFGSFDLSSPSFANIENLTMSGADNSTATGNDLNNILMGGRFGGNVTLIGGAGDDTLIGDAPDSGLKGNDTLIGGTGNDTYFVSSLTDTVTEFDGKGSGKDTVILSADGFALTANLENLIIAADAGNIDGTGNELDNTITGNAGNNLLQGSGGNDTILGGAGNDTLSGGDGNDALTGGAGNDLYLIRADDLHDKVIEASNGGIDTVQSEIDGIVLAGNVENLVLIGNATHATGNAIDNAITGSVIADTIDGAAGNDTIAGGFGDDALLGGTGNDTLDGGGGADHLLGGAGNDRLEGGVEADTLEGGAGNDLFRVDDFANNVLEAKGQGIDTVETGLNGYTLTDNVENLTLLGGGNIAGHGNALDNHLTGNAGSNNLSGEAGNDLLEGLGGNDSVDGGAGNDVLRGGEGNDGVIGGTGDDTLEGGLGQDVLIGGAGKDVFVYQTSDRAVAELQNLGSDTILDFQHGQDKIDVRDLIADFGLDHGDAVAAGNIVLTQNGADTIVQLDLDGNGGGAPFTLATVVGVTLTAADILA